MCDISWKHSNNFNPSIRSNGTSILHRIALENWIGNNQFETIGKHIEYSSAANYNMVAACVLVFKQITAKPPNVTESMHNIWYDDDHLCMCTGYGILSNPNQWVPMQCDSPFFNSSFTNDTFPVAIAQLSLCRRQCNIVSNAHQLRWRQSSF